MRVGIVGATGAVGQELIDVLADRNFPVSELKLFASERSAGKTLETSTGKRTLQAYDRTACADLDIVFLAVSGSFAEAEAPALSEKSIVIDNSSAFRYRPEVPLVTPEINPQAIGDARLIANPNCTTLVAAVALWPIHQAFGLKKVIVSSYQATSGAGAEGMAELQEQTKVVIGGGEAGHKVFQHPIPFNVIPHIDSFQPNGYTREEMKVCWETRKIFGLPELLVSCTAVRVPTLRAHAEAITIETERPVTPDAVRALLAKAPGVKLVDDPSANLYPMPLTASGQYDVEVGRIRQSIVFGDHGLDLFVCGDQLLKGAALNAVQIAEVVVARQGAKPELVPAE